MFGLLLFGILLSFALPLALGVFVLAVLSGVLVLLAKLFISSGGFPIGIAIGLILYNMIRRRHAEKKAETRVEAREEVRANESVNESETLTETTMSRYNGTGCGY